MPLNQQNMKLLITEIGIMKTSVHPNIVKYIDSYLVNDIIWVKKICYHFYNKKF